MSREALIDESRAGDEVDGGDQRMAPRRPPQPVSARGAVFSGLDPLCDRHGLSGLVSLSAGGASWAIHGCLPRVATPSTTGNPPVVPRGPPVV